VKVRALPPADHPVRPLSQRLGAILWPSFFSAGVATAVFGALVDPIELRDITFPELQLTRGVGYTIAFFMFWLSTASASAFTWYLLRPASRFNRASLKDEP
jgi:hypothetical protein